MVLYSSYIRYNKLPNEIFFLKLEYDGGDITFAINKIGYKLSVDDYELGKFSLVNKNINNSNFSNQIMKDLNEFGNSFELEYIKAFSEIKINGKTIKVDNNQIMKIMEKLFQITLSYVKNDFLPYKFPLNFNRIDIYYQYEFKNARLNGYLAYTPQYIYTVSHNFVDSFRILKVNSDGEAEELFRIETGLYKYSKSILYKVVNLVLQSGIKTNDYEIEIAGKDVVINNKKVNVQSKAVDDVTNSIKNQIEYIVNNIKNKLNALS